MSKFPETTVTFVDAIKDGSIKKLEVWERYCERYYNAVTAFASERLSDQLRTHADAEDIAHEVLNKLWRTLSGGAFDHRKMGAFGCYCRTFIMNAIRDLAKKAYVKHEVLTKENDDGQQDETIFDVGNRPCFREGAQHSARVSPGPDAEVFYDTVDEIDNAWCNAFWRAVEKDVFHRARYDETHRAILQKVIFDGESADDVARAYDRTANNVAQIKSRFVKAVRKNIKALMKDGFLMDAALFLRVEKKEV